MPVRAANPSLKARKHPQQARARASRDAILEAAAQILERDGLAGYTTNAVAARAGVSIGTLYQYFPNRDAVTAALAARVQEMRGMAAGEGQRPRFSAALDHEEARLPLDPVIAPALAALDRLLAEFLGRHLPTVPEAALAHHARLCRTVARALIDEFRGDDGAAATAALTAYLAAVRR